MSELNKLGAASGLEVSTAVNQITEEVNGINIEGGGGGTGGSTNAADITVSAEAEHYSGKSVENALQDVGADLTSKADALKTTGEQLQAHGETLQAHNETLQSHSEAITSLQNAPAGIDAGKAVAMSLIFG